MKYLYTLALFLCFQLSQVKAQNNAGLTDGRHNEGSFETQEMITNKPKEVLFGIGHQNGEVTFTMTSENWFNKIMSDDHFGIAADFVSKDQFSCFKPGEKQKNWNRGIVTKPVYRRELLARLKKDESSGYISINLGDIPYQLKGKEIEGNLVIVHDNQVYYYTEFENINTERWNLLDMGLYTDTLIKNEDLAAYNPQTGEPGNIYKIKRSVVIPFEKGKSGYNEQDIKNLYNIMGLKGYTVQKIEIRSYSSVEGSLKANIRLQNQRAGNIASAINSFQKKNITTSITSGENWIEFMQSIENSQFESLKNLSKADIKAALKRKTLRDSLESRLSAQRKAIVTVYLNPASPVDNTSNIGAIDTINRYIKLKRIDQAEKMLWNIFVKIADNHIPSEYIDKIEVPRSKEFANLNNDIIAYKYMSRRSTIAEAIHDLKEMHTQYPDNGKIRYNICALTIELWQNNETLINRDSLRHEITDMAAYGIPVSLVNRMMINYGIIRCEQCTRNEQFDAKDSELAMIKANYLDKDLSDKDLLNIGKYFCEYIQYQWADEIIAPRMIQLDVDEDLLFFYLKLCIFRRVSFEEDNRMQMLLNAISINNSRFCGFFNSRDDGGISMQLLYDGYWKDKYCENCTSTETESE